MYRKTRSFHSCSRQRFILLVADSIFHKLMVTQWSDRLLIYSLAMSLAVSMAAQKYGGDSTHPIRSEVGITIRIGFPSGCGRTYEKLYSPPYAQSRRQKPSLMTHFAIDIFAVLSASANSCIIRDKQSPIWSIAPFGVFFLLCHWLMPAPPIL